MSLVLSTTVLSYYFTDLALDRVAVLAPQHLREEVPADLDPHLDQDPVHVLL